MLLRQANEKKLRFMAQRNRFARGLTFGTKTKHKVIVVQNIINKPMMMKAALGWSLMTKDTAAPHTHIITTL